MSGREHESPPGSRRNSKTLVGPPHSPFRRYSHKMIPQLEDQLNAAYIRYKHAKQQATIWREEFLEGIARAKAKDKGTNHETEAKQLKPSNNKGWLHAI